MQSLAQEAAALLAARESSVAVSCLSGRGRTGTFSAIVVGKLLSIKTLSELVDVIVSMRENRDGLVETPAQFRFAAHALDLPDPSQCNFPCYVTRLHESVLRSHIHAPYVIGMIVGSLACLTLEATSKDRTMLDAISRVLQALKGHQYEPLYDATASRKIPPPVLEVEVTAGIDNDKDL
jgi:Protein-tyrosine phosphatase